MKKKLSVGKDVSFGVGKYFANMLPPILRRTLCERFCEIYLKNWKKKMGEFAEKFSQVMTQGDEKKIQ